MAQKPSTLTQIAQSRTALDQEFLSRQSFAWFQKNLEDLKSPIKLAKEIATEKSRQGGRFQMGGLYQFVYDPLTKADLPYYDMFPLVIPLQREQDGFIGLNLHYLPPAYRAAFLDKLMQFAIVNENDEPKRLRVTYDILATSRRYKEFRACTKHYLNSQIKSKILTIKPNEWETALFLPTSVFRGAPTQAVYKQSVQKANARIY
jgi:hypothetical protein